MTYNIPDQSPKFCFGLFYFAMDVSHILREPSLPVIVRTQSLLMRKLHSHE